MLAQTTQPFLTTSAFWLPIVTTVIGAVITDLDAFAKSREQGKPFDWTLTAARVFKAALVGSLISLGASTAGI